MENIKPYVSNEFREFFTKTDLYVSLEKDFDYLFWEKYGNPVPRLMLQNRVVSLSSFYYLNFLLEKNPKTIYDIGCGTNAFKKYFPNIIGVDPNTDFGNFPDIVRAFDDAFVEEYENSMDSAFSINAIHFTQISDYNQQINKFLRLLKPGGRAFITFNSLVGILFTHSVHKIKFYDYFPEGGTVEERKRAFFENFDIGSNKLICLDVEILDSGCSLLGDIRMVIEKA